MRASPLRLCLALSLSAAFSVATVTASYAQSDQTPEQDVGLAGDSVVMRQEAGAAGPSPHGCRGHSNNPHKSTTPATAGNIKGYAETGCTTNTDRLHVEASVWRKRWWGYEEKGTRGAGTYSSSTKIGRSGHWNGCDNNNWRTVGNHWSIESGNKYSAESMNYKQVTGC